MKKVGVWILAAVLLLAVLTACAGPATADSASTPEEYCAAIGLTREEALAALGLTEDDISQERSPYSLLVTSSKMELGGMPFEIWLQLDADSNILYGVTFTAQTEGQNEAYFDAVKAYAAELQEAYGDPVTVDGLSFYLTEFDSYPDAPKEGTGMRDTWAVEPEGELADRMPLTFTQNGESVEFVNFYAIVSATFDERDGAETAECRIEYRVAPEGMYY